MNETKATDMTPEQFARWLDEKGACCGGKQAASGKTPREGWLTSSKSWHLMWVLRNCQSPITNEQLAAMMLSIPIRDGLCIAQLPEYADAAAALRQYISDAGTEEERSSRKELLIIGLIGKEPCERRDVLYAVANLCPEVFARHDNPSGNTWLLNYIRTNFTMPER